MCIKIVIISIYRNFVNNRDKLTSIILNRNHFKITDVFNETLTKITIFRGSRTYYLLFGDDKSSLIRPSIIVMELLHSPTIIFKSE